MRWGSCSQPAYKKSFRKESVPKRLSVHNHVHLPALQGHQKYRSVRLIFHTQVSTSPATLQIPTRSSGSEGALKEGAEFLRSRHTVVESTHVNNPLPGKTVPRDITPDPPRESLLWKCNSLTWKNERSRKQRELTRARLPREPGRRLLASNGTRWLDGKSKIMACKASCEQIVFLECELLLLAVRQGYEDLQQKMSTRNESRMVIDHLSSQD